MRKRFALVIVVLATLASYKKKPGASQQIRVDKTTRIVLLNPALTEVLCVAGYAEVPAVRKPGIPKLAS